jgi:hypothetical protein
LWLESEKHKPILDDLESNRLISKHEIQFEKRTVTVYKPTVRGIEFCRSILEPYKKMLPRRKTIDDDDANIASSTINGQKVCRKDNVIADSHDPGRYDLRSRCKEVISDEDDKVRVVGGWVTDNPDGYPRWNEIHPAWQNRGIGIMMVPLFVKGK